MDSQPIRTRQISDKLSYPSLVKKGLIPDVMQLLDSYPNACTCKRHPPFVYKNKSMAEYGMVFDYIIRAGFRSYLPGTKFDLGVDPLVNIIQSLNDDEMIKTATLLSKYETSTNLYDIVLASYKMVEMTFGNPGFDCKDLSSNIGNITNIIKALSEKWKLYSPYFKGNVKYNYEISQGNLCGHPDVVCDNAIFDIKTTSSFKSMSESSFLQVLSYYAQMKPTHPDMQYIGFILPNQKELIIFDISSWNSTKFLEYLLDKADKLVDIKKDEKKDEQLAIIIGNKVLTPVFIKNKEELDEEGISLFNKISQSPDLLIGNHIQKGNNLTQTLKDYITNRPGCPTQLFLRNKLSTKMDKKTHDHVESCSKLIKETGLKCFIHAPYTINLCVDAVDLDDNRHWAQDALNDDLIMGNKLGFKGVVVHLGNKTTQDEEMAINTMERMVRNALPFATPECKLLLETGCDEKGEVCAMLEQLGLFFYRFNDEERKKLGLVCDSCHLMSSGQDPLEFMKNWEQYFDVTIALIHFNDSKTPFNSKVDRHAPIGKGTIGYKKMLEIALWATERNIPLVIE